MPNLEVEMLPKHTKQQANGMDAENANRTCQDLYSWSLAMLYKLYGWYVVLLP